MPEMPIPNDWDGVSWACWLVDWPDSLEYAGIMRGFLTEMTRGRFWDGKTGSIIGAQNVGLQVIERNSPLVSCEDLVIALQGIETAIQSIDVSQTQSVSVLTDIDLQMTAMATALADANSLSVSQAASVATSLAWSQAFAQATLSVVITNNVQLQFRPLDPVNDPPPLPPEETTTGISSAPQDMADDPRCRRAFWTHDRALAYWTYVRDHFEQSSGSALSLLGLIADAAAAAAVSAGGPVRALIWPASIILQMSHLMAEIYQQGIQSLLLDDMVEWLTEQRTVVVCHMYNGTFADRPTPEIQDLIFASAISSGISPQFLPFVRLTFNLGLLASLYYVSPLQDPLPPVPPPYNAFICLDCEA